MQATCCFTTFDAGTIVIYQKNEMICGRYRRRIPVYRRVWIRQHACLEKGEGGGGVREGDNRPLAPKFYKGIPRDSGLGTDKGCFFEFFIFFISSKRSVIWKYLRWL